MSDEAIKTVAGEITKIAVEHGYNGVAPRTITGAIDALADTLAGSDVDSGQTVAQAVRALAPYIGSGGGGTTLGSLQNGIVTADVVPVVGNAYESSSAYILSAKAGNTVVFGRSPNRAILSSANAPGIAAGLVVTFIYDFLSEQSPDVSAYVITTEFDEDSGNDICTSARQWDGQLDVNIGEQDPEFGSYTVEVTLTVPELDVDGGEMLVICFTGDNDEPGGGGGAI